MSEMPQVMKWHRVKFYPAGNFSTFDTILKCPAGPGKSCWGCQNNHPACDAQGRIVPILPVT